MWKEQKNDSSIAEMVEMLDGVGVEKNGLEKRKRCRESREKNQKNILHIFKKIIIIKYNSL